MDFKKIINMLANVDRRVVYFFVFLMVSLPFFMKPVVSIRVTDEVRNSFNLVDEAARLKRPIMIGFDYNPSTQAELQPMADAILKHAFSKNVKVLGWTYIADGVSMGTESLARIGKEYGKVEGEDYVYLGFIPSLMAGIIGMGDDIRKVSSKDIRKIDLDNIPMMQNIRNYDDFHALFCLTGTGLPLSYVTYGVNKFKFNFVAGVTAVSASENYVFVDAKQMVGLLPGMKGAAEYEYLLGEIADAMRGMASQTWGHLTIIFFIIFGNIMFYIKARLDRKEA